MDNLDLIVSLEHLAKLEAQKEAYEHFRKELLIEKAKRSGYLKGNELYYYNYFIEMVY